VRIYLDACCLQRPFDDQTQPRIRVEAEAVLAVLAAVQAGDVTLVTSDALDFEIGRIPDEQRRSEAFAMLTLAVEHLEIEAANETTANALVASGLSAMDALHVALASRAAVDYFATTDDRLLRHARSAPGLSCQPISLLSLISEINK
jgi:predicted nucleic acid-binding protein